MRLSEQLPHWHKPKEGVLEAMRSSRSNDALDYPHFGATQGELPVGFRHIDHEWELGRGSDCFRAVRDVMRHWRMLPEWVHVHPSPVAEQPGSTLILQLKLMSLWWVSPVRLLINADASANARQCAIAYGTLPGHHARGEERFEANWLDDDRVVFRLRAFSRWKKVLPRIFSAAANHYQDRFATAVELRLRSALQGRWMA